MPDHWMFFYPCGCSFSVMHVEHWPTEAAAWLEAFDTPGRIELAREHGVTVKKVSTGEWRENYQERFGECTHRPDPDPLRRNKADDGPDLEQMAIDRAVEVQLDTYWENVYTLLDDEKSELWRAFADVVEKLQPDIGPWDKRELVSAIVAEFKAVLDDC